MFKAGTLPAPIIQPLRYDTIGTRIKVDSESYIQIRSGNLNNLNFFYSVSL